MKNKKIFVLWFLTAACFWGIFFYLSQNLPDIVPSHFNLEGQPDRMGTRKSFLGLTAIVWFLINGVFGLITLVANKISPNHFNWPDKKWWLATPERQQVLQSRISGLLSLQAINGNVIFCLAIMMPGIHSGILPDIFPIKYTVVLIFVMVAITLVTTLLFVRKPQTLNTKAP